MKVITQVAHEITRLTASISGRWRVRVLKSLQDGTYGSERTPPYQSQFASRDRVGEFLDSPEALQRDTQWKQFGFETLDDYVFWAPRLCGIACFKIILGNFGVDGDETIAALTMRALRKGAYVLQDETGRDVDKGWYYKPLVELSHEFGLTGVVFRGWTVETVCADLLDGGIVVASVNPNVIREDIDTTPEHLSGGHLVVVYGFKWSNGTCEGLYIHNPSGRSRRTQESYLASVDRFTEAYAGRGFSLRRSS